MSVQMRLVHTRMGMTPPALHSGESAREMALHAPQPSPMPARMRARFTATTDGGVTRVLPKRGLPLGRGPRLLARWCLRVSAGRGAVGHRRRPHRPHRPARHYS